MDPAQYLRILRIRWPVVAALVLLGALVGYVTAPAEAETPEDATLYLATTVLLVEGDETAGLTTSQIQFFATLEEVPQRVADRLGGDPELLAEQVTVTFDPEVGFMNVQSVNADEQTALEIADAFGEELIAWVEERAAAEQAQERDEVFGRLDALEAEVRELDERIQSSPPTEAELLQAERDSVLNQVRLERERLQVLVADGAPSSGLSIARSAEATPISGTAYLDFVLEQTGVDQTADIEGDAESDEDAEDADGVLPQFVPPSEAEEPVSPAQRAVLGGALGLALGAIVVGLLARFDTRIRTRDAAEEAFGLPVLADIPAIERKDARQVVAATRPRSKWAEAYRSLRTSLAVSSVGAPPSANGKDADGSHENLRVVMVTSPNPGDGKSTTVANLAAVLAEAGQRVLVVDCDYRRPTVHQLLGVTQAPTLGGATEAEVRSGARRFIVPTGIDGVSLATTAIDTSLATSDPAAAIVIQRAFIAVSRRRFDAVILDTAPILLTNDASDLLTSTDAVLLVARTGRTRRVDAERAAEQLARLGAPLAGAVLLGARSPARSGPYTYYEDARPGAAAGKDAPTETAPTSV